MYVSKRGTLDLADLLAVGKPGLWNKSKEQMERMVGRVMKIATGDALGGCGPSIKKEVEEEDEVCAQ
jgi:hypothetical protein